MTAEVPQGVRLLRAEDAQACVIFTSESTRRPRGVAATQGRL
ncbi:hypothetical protein ACRS6B_10785 [Nocardia asteroides]